MYHIGYLFAGDAACLLCDRPLFVCDRLLSFREGSGVCSINNSSWLPSTSTSHHVSPALFNRSSTSTSTSPLFFLSIHLIYSSFQRPFMFSRLSQLTRHLSRPLPNYAHSSAASSAKNFKGGIMTSIISADERATRTIHTAACLIIGDEVLGGKVCPVLKDLCSLKGILIA